MNRRRAQAKPTPPVASDSGRLPASIDTHSIKFNFLNIFFCVLTVTTGKLKLVDDINDDDFFRSRGQILQPGTIN